MPSKSKIQEVIDRYGSEIVKATKERMLKGETRINSQGKAYHAAPVNTGKLLKSVVWKVRYFGKNWEFNILAEDYFLYLDTGRGRTKGQSKIFPDSKMLEWVKSKRLGFDKKGNLRSLTKKQALKVPSLDSQQRSLADVIKRKIHKKGFKGYGFFEPHMEEVLKNFKKDLSIAAGKEIEFDIKTWQ